MKPDIEKRLPSALSSAQAVLSTTTRLLRTMGDPDAADRIIGQATASTGIPVVVFVGERGRGKSSLINLLAPDVHNTASEGSDQERYRWVVPSTGDGPDGGGAWANPDGGRPGSRADSLDLLGVEVETRDGLLGDVILLDAPSSGGLGAAQSLLNLKILEAAAVAVFVTDAGSLLSAAEMAYLEQCSAQVETVGVVVTKTDLYPGSWQDVVLGNAALLKNRISRVAETFVLGVSPVTAMAAGSVTEPTVRDSLLEASGFPQLVQALKLELSRSTGAPTANALRMCHTALARGRQSRLTQLAIAAAPVEARAEMMAKVQRLFELKEQQQRWSLDLERDLGELRAGVMREAISELDEWATRWRNRLQSTPGLRMGQRAQQYSSDIFAEILVLRADLITKAEEQLGALLHELFRDIPLPAVLNELLMAGERPSETPHMGSEKSHTGFDPTVAMSLMVGSNMGRSVVTLLPALGLGGAALLGLPLAALSIPITVAGAGGWYAVNRFYRQNMLEKNRLMSEIPKLAQSERAVIGDYLDSRLRRLKPEIVVTYRAQLQDSLTRLQQLIQESQAQEQLSAQAALERLESIKREVSTIDKHMADVDRSLMKLRGTQRPGEMQSVQGRAENEII